MSVETALARLTATTGAAAQAMENEAKARAEWGRESLLALAEANPQIMGYSFETEWEYDDEGDYFPTVSVYADQAEHSLEMEYELEDEIFEIQHNLDHAAVELLGERVTVDELKEVKF